MSTPKGKNKKISYFQCEKCHSILLNEYLEKHPDNCPPNKYHQFIQHEVLYGVADIKVNENIKGISQEEKDNCVFLSQSCIQLCGFAIGEAVIVSDLDGKFAPCSRVVWPTEEKSLTSVLLTKNGLDTSFDGEKCFNVSVKKMPTPIYQAKRVCLIGNLQKLDLSTNLVNRIHKFHVDRFLTRGNKIAVKYFGKSLKFEVKCILINDEKSDTIESLQNEFANLKFDGNSHFCKVINSTQFSLFGNEVEYSKANNKINLLSKIGGLDEEISEIRDLLNSALGRLKTLSNCIISRGVLIYGSSGTGKTMVAEALANESNVNLITISNKELYKDLEQNIEETIAKYFADVIKLAPSIVLLDEIDLFCPSKTTRTTDSDKRIMSNLLNLFDYIQENPSCNIFVMATSNKPDLIDATLRRCGRLDREIEIPTPTPKGRLAILTKLLDGLPVNMDDEKFKEIAYSTHGFVGSDLMLLCSRASLRAMQQHNSSISWEDFKFALTRVRPSAMREVQIEVPNVKWSDIGGQEELKLILRQAVEWPLKHPESFVRMGITPPRGVLMFGPPGCSKTMIAKALATESSLNFLSIKGPELFSKWVGESERAVRDVFKKARQVAPSIIFFDEIDALGGERSSGSSTSVQERVLAQLLTELDGVTPLGDVTVLAATNRPDRIDRALLRPGRLDRIVYVPLPTYSTREEIFKLKLAKMPVLDVDIEQLVHLTDGFSGAEVNALCHEAAMKALEEDLESKHVTWDHFLQALQLVTPRTSQALLEIYKQFVK